MDPQPPPIKIKLDASRSKLCEGRSIGIGYAFLKKIGEAAFEGIMPISPCKDYLNDVVYSEHTGNPYHIWGLSTTKKDCFDTRAYLAISTCHEKCGSGNPHFAKEREMLEKHLPKLEGMLNRLEEALGIKERTKLVHVADNLVFASIPLEWVGSTWAISLWSLLFRCLIYLKDDDPLLCLEKTESSADRMYINNIMPKLKHFFQNGLPKCDWSSFNGPHNQGIVSFKLKG